MTSAVLWYTPAVRRSKSEPTITTSSSRARRVKLSLVGPGIGSARSNRSARLFAAEILRAEQFLHADDLRAFARRFADAPFGLGQILVGIFGAGHLDQAEREFRFDAHYLL